MRFPATYTRYVGSLSPGQVALGSDVLLVDTNGSPRKPQVGVDTNFLSSRTLSMNGTPLDRVALACKYTGAGVAISLPVQMYVFEDNLQVYLPLNSQAGTVGGSVMPGTTTAPALPLFFDALTLIDQPATSSMLQYPQPGGSTFLCIVTAAGGTPNGRYDFVLGAELTSRPF
jgi:hypothetical protein